MIFYFLSFYSIYVYLFIYLATAAPQSALWIWMSAFDGEQSKLPIGSSANWRKSNKLSAGEISNNPKIRKTDKTSLFASSIESDIAYNLADPQGNRLEPQIKWFPIIINEVAGLVAVPEVKWLNFRKTRQSRNIWRAGAYMAQYRNIPVWNSITTNAAGKVLLFGEKGWTQDLQKKDVVGKVNFFARS